MILVDTNVLVYALNHDDAPQHLPSRMLLQRAERGELALCVTSQVLTEFFSIVTSPRRTKKPSTAIEAADVIEELLGWPGMTFLPQTPDVPGRWIELIRQRPVRGAKVFDLQLAATALANGVSQIYTYNVADFEPIEGLEVIIP